jgi:hypothetical protein
VQSEGTYIGEQDNELLKVDFLNHGELFQHLEHGFLRVTGETGDSSLLYSQIVFLPVCVEDAPRALFVGVDAMLDVEEFATILNDRTFNWKLRTTIDYSAVQGPDDNQLNDALYPTVSGPPGKNKKVEARKEVPLTEGDFFHSSSNFLQKDED